MKIRKKKIKQFYENFGSEMKLKREWNKGARKKKNNISNLGESYKKMFIVKFLPVQKKKMKENKGLKVKIEIKKKLE